MKFIDVKKFFKVFLKNYTDSVDYTHVELTFHGDSFHGSSRYCRELSKRLEPQVVALQEVTFEIVDSLCGSCCSSLGLVRKEDVKNYSSDVNFPLVSILECIENIHRFNDLKILKEEINGRDFLRVLEKEQFLFTEILYDLNYLEENSTLFNLLYATSDEMNLMFKALSSDSDFMLALKQKAAAEVTNQFIDRMKLAVVKDNSFISEQTNDLFVKHFSESKANLEKELLDRTSWILTNYHGSFTENAWLYLFALDFSKFNEDTYYLLPSVFFEALPKKRVDSINDMYYLTLEKEISEEVVETFNVLVNDKSKGEINSKMLQELLEVAEKI